MGRGEQGWINPVEHFYFVNFVLYMNVPYADYVRKKKEKRIVKNKTMTDAFFCLHTKIAFRLGRLQDPALYAVTISYSFARVVTI